MQVAKGLVEGFGIGIWLSIKIVIWSFLGCLLLMGAVVVGFVGAARIPSRFL